MLAPRDWVPDPLVDPGGSRANVFHFDMYFHQKNTHVGSWHPESALIRLGLRGQRPTQREILDPPLTPI